MMSKVIIIGVFLAGWIYLLSGCGDGGPANLCAGVTCSGHGICVVNGGRPMCGCDEGYRPDPSAGLSCQPLKSSGDDPDQGLAPSWPEGAGLEVADIGPTSLTLGWPAAVAHGGRAAAGYRIFRDDALYAVTPGHQRDVVAAGLEVGTRYRFRVQARDEQGHWTTDGPAAEASTRAVLPADPAGLAPELDRTQVSTFSEATEFLYSGDAPLQVGVEPGTIEPHRAAVLRGLVSAADSSPLAGVTVSVLDRPELGRTTTRHDGAFDLAVNGGQLL
ncbi:MAG: fibronectin type III domain-containing protein, partial [bacterium]